MNLVSAIRTDRKSRNSVSTEHDPWAEHVPDAWRRTRLAREAARVRLAALVDPAP
jgi:hypothetical protein